jgi:uncharacterized membrane protein YqhA
MINKVFSFSRYIFLIAVLSCFIAATTLIILAGIETVQLVVKAVSTSLDIYSIKTMGVSFLVVIDILLLGAVFYITALGIYELFIDENISTPSWLHITHVDDLKSILLSVVVVILAVIFLGQVANWDGQSNVLAFAAAIGVVIGAITLFLGWQHKKD